jgi:uncharacterized Zn finger protein (UPF0148 family)
MFCHKCGSRFLKYHNFCAYCGADIKKEKETYSEEYDKITARLDNLTIEELESLFKDKRNEIRSMDKHSVEYWNAMFELEDNLDKRGELVRHFH